MYCSINKMLCLVQIICSPFLEIKMVKLKSYYWCCIIYKALVSDLSTIKTAPKAKSDARPDFHIFVHVVHLSNFIFYCVNKQL